MSSPRSLYAERSATEAEVWTGYRYCWSEAANVDFPQLSEALNAVGKKGKYSPPKSHPLKSWWENASSPDNQR
ncbi:MAG: hypothetical protein F6K39_16290 [Okeania sp. SIO3B3]|nr:hypothetical protein [Okeania sp. SIO3B3]